MMLSNLGIMRINADDTAGAAQVMYASVCLFFVFLFVCVRVMSVYAVNAIGG